MTALCGPELHWLGMRLFVGIALADAVTRELAAVVARLRNGGERSGARGLRWTGQDSWHITLQFLGNATEEQLECLNLRLGDVRAAPVPVRLGELGSFDRAGVFLADVAVTPELAALEQKVIEATNRCGFVAEARPFHPHITLARTKGHGSKGELRKLLGMTRNQPVFSGFTTREFLLYESPTERDGARYEVRGRFVLGRP